MKIIRFIEAHQIWKAASDLGVKYVHDYLASEHPQVGTRYWPPYRLGVNRPTLCCRSQNGLPTKRGSPVSNAQTALFMRSQRTRRVTWSTSASGVLRWKRK